MSFKNKMKNRGISKLDNLVETPDYIEVKKPEKRNLNWLKIAIPVAAGLALVIVPISVISANGVFRPTNSSKSGIDGNHYSPDSESGYSAPESQSGMAVKDAPFATLLTNHQINGNYVIEVYDYADGYTEPTYTFSNEDSLSIINCLKGINSDMDGFSERLNASTTKRNNAGYLMGINHRLIIKDGNNKLITNYFSQFSTIVVEDSAFDIKGTEAYTLMDTHIEMDYNPDYDETIN